MSGHSKWANIKRKKGANDARRSGTFTKIGRELAVAVKNGGADPDTNARLRDVIAKAKAANLPNDNIYRSIKKASGELGTVNYEEIIYEGYGAGGVAVIVETLTDNKNRTAGNVRCYFDKFGGALGTTGCVSYMFAKKGIIVIDVDGKDDEELMMMALECGADDVNIGDGICEIYTAPADFSVVREALEADTSLKILSAEMGMLPENYIKPDQTNMGKVLRMLDTLEDDDDVQNVYHNCELDDEE